MSRTVFVESSCYEPESQELQEVHGICTDYFRWKECPFLWRRSLNYLVVIRRALIGFFEYFQEWIGTRL